MNLLALYAKSGKIRLFDGAGVSKTVLTTELINNVAKAHGHSVCASVTHSASVTHIIEST